MSGALSEQFDPMGRGFTPEPVARPLLKSIGFHLALIAGGVAFAYMADLFPHNTWGGTNEGSAIAVSLVSSALPLPQDRPPNDNVLATEHPSEAPAPPTPKAQATVDNSAIPIATKMEAPKKQADKRQEASKPLKPVTPTQTTTKASPHTQPAKNDNRAQFGEQASTQMARSTVPSTSSANGQVSVTAGSKGFNYPFYVETIQRKVRESTYRGEVDPRTPKAARTYIYFTIRRDGSVTDVKLDKSSGSPTLDQACQRAAKRVDTFGPLPSPTSDGNLSVSYYCDY
jgi:periplasmic protein TonB